MKKASYYETKVGELDVYVMTGNTQSHDVIRDVVNTNDVTKLERPMYCTNLDSIIEQSKLWKEKLPNVRVHASVKTYNSPVIVQLLNNLGHCFDVASKSEAQNVLELGIPSEKVTSDHPYKSEVQLQYYAKQGLNCITVDSLDELEKIARYHPKAQVLLRILPAPDHAVDGLINTRVDFKGKFGATEAQAKELLHKGKELGVNFIGVSFHVGTDVNDITLHKRTLENAIMFFQMAKLIGYDFKILNIGGGYTGRSKNAVFIATCNALGPALEEYFPKASGITVMAEPGRFFVEEAATAYMRVTGRRRVMRRSLLEAVPINQQGNGYEDETSEMNSYFYIVNDGIWESMSFIAIDSLYEPLEMLSPRPAGRKYPSIVWGPSCHEFDRLTKIENMEELKLGDWLYRTNAGAYSHTCRTSFNSMPKAKLVYTIKEENLPWIQKNGGIKVPY